MVEALIDGERAGSLPADDRGLLYGDHLFETVAFVKTRAPLWDLHMARLAHDARRLLMPMPDPSLLACECQRLIEGRERAVVRITISRGSGGRAYEPPPNPSPRRIVMRRAWPQGLKVARERGIALHISPVRLAVGGVLVGIKHGNRLEQVLAAEHARRSGVDEAVVFDGDGRLVEAIAGNLLVMIDGQAVTPRLIGAGVAGVGLQWLREKVGAELTERELDAGDLRRSEGLLVINSVAGIRPARLLDGRPLAVPERVRRWQRLWNELFECED